MEREQYFEKNDRNRSQAQQDECYMRRAIELAKRGGGWTNPNPNVGAVIVKDGKILGEGYHQRCGQLHAERNAFASLTESAEGATIYVTLEPCCHYGKTPPCTEAIIEHKLARVVIGSRDPNPLVAGKGASLLREKGIVVQEDFLREECDAINPIFFHYITTKMPYVTMKYAMTLDGKIATRTGASKWITGETARSHVHQLRSRYAAILAGIGTVLADDPLLNARTEGAHQPLRIIADTHLQIPIDCQIVKTAKEYPTVVACGKIENPTSQLEEKRRRLAELGVELFELPIREGHLDLRELAVECGKRKIDSILVEGGGTLHEACLRAGIVKHICAYVAPKIFGGASAKSPVEGCGVELPSQAEKLMFRAMTQLGEDLLLEYDVTGGNAHVHRDC